MVMVACLFCAQPLAASLLSSRQRSWQPQHTNTQKPLDPCSSNAPSCAGTRKFGVTMLPKVSFLPSGQCHVAIDPDVATGLVICAATIESFVTAIVTDPSRVVFFFESEKMSYQGAGTWHASGYDHA